MLSDVNTQKGPTDLKYIQWLVSKVKLTQTSAQSKLDKNHCPAFNLKMRLNMIKTQSVVVELWFPGWDRLKSRHLIAHLRVH